MRVLLVHNPSAGDGNLSRDHLLELLRRAGFVPDCVDAKDPELEAVLGRPTDLVLVAGGDGSVVRTAVTLPDRDVPMAVLPLGTANNLARTFGIEGDPERIVAGLEGAGRRRLDVGEARGPWGRRRFVESVGLGALADAMHAAHESDAPSQDRARRAWSELRQALVEAEPRHVDVHTENGPSADRALLLEVLNIAFAGSGLPLAPAADPGDGTLDVLVVGEAQREAMLDWLGRCEAGTPPPVPLMRGRSVRFTWTEGLLRLGDEFLDPPNEPSPVELTFEPVPVTVLIPRGAGGDDA